MTDDREDWERVEDTMLRGKGICWVDAPHGSAKLQGSEALTVCGLVRASFLWRAVYWRHVTCPVCVAWLKARGKTWE